jgi:hypothetical protein
MSYIGSTPTTQSFIAGTDYFNGTGSAVNFTLSRSVNSVNDIEVIVNNVEQIPSGYSVSGTTLTFSAAPSAGTSNVYVRYLSTTNLSLVIPSGTSATFNTVTVADGSAAAPSITNDGDTNTGIFFPAADTIAFAEGGVEAARFDSAGNMGLGATPSAWGSNNRTIDMYGIGSFSSFSNGSGGYELDVGLNAYNSASGWRYKVSSYAVALYQQAAGSHIWYNAAAGTAGNAISFTQAMTLDSSGNVGIGTTATTYNYQTKNIALYDASSAGISIVGGAKILTLTAQSSGGIFVGSRSNDNLIFATNDIERARIDTSGNLLVGTTSGTGASERFALAQDNPNWIHTIRNSSASSPFGSQIWYTGSDPNNTSNFFFGCYGGGAQTLRMNIRSNGGIANYSANNSNLSDRREKTNFAPAKSYLDVICAIPVQTFNYIDQNLEEDAGLTLGIVAQDVQAVAPELVMESNWANKDETPKMRLSIYQTDLQYALMKCIQEQQALITALTTRTSALEERLAALENNNATQ